VDLLGLELGYRLIALVDKSRQGDLLTRIKGVRRKFAQEVGFLPPAVHVRDNLELKPSAYRMTLRGVMVGEGEAFPGMFLAINPGGITTPLIGTATTDPAFGLPAHWIDERQKEAAQMAGFTVVDSETVMATHLSHLMQVHAAKLLSRTETQQLVDHVAKLAPKLIEEVIPKMVPITTFQKVLQLLLEDSVHIRDIRTIIETLAENATQTTDPVELARRVRIALSPAIVQQIYGPTRELNVIAIEPGLERLLVQALSNPNAPSLDPGVAEILTQKRSMWPTNRKSWACPPACWCRTRSATLLPSCCAVWRRVCRCSRTARFPRRTPSASARFLKVQPHEYQTLLRPDRPRGPGQGAHGFWRRHPDSLQPPDAGRSGSHGHGRRDPAGHGCRHADRLAPAKGSGAPRKRRRHEPAQGALASGPRCCQAQPGGEAMSTLEHVQARQTAKEEQAREMQVQAKPVKAINELAQHSVQDDVEQLSMSTLTFQDYVRERMLRRRHESSLDSSEALPTLPSACRSAITSAPPWQPSLRRPALRWFATILCAPRRFSSRKAPGPPARLRLRTSCRRCSP
jgi:hypothetical protein